MFIMREQLQKRQRKQSEEVGASVVRAVDLMQGNTDGRMWWQQCRELDEDWTR